MMALTLVGLAVCLPLWITDLVFLAEVLLGLRPRAPVPPAAPAAPAAPFALIVPAHNEEAHVRASVARMIARAPADTRVLVVAHNCSDRTADEALAAGAAVHVLDEPGRRGKGYALAGGRAALAVDPPAIVILVDADCEPDVGALSRLAVAVERSGRAVQANYLFRPAPGASLIVQISNFAMLVKNLIRQRGGHRLGAPAVLTGSGIAMPWSTFAALELATSNIVEDLAMGVELVRQGRAPLFEEGATIWSAPSSEAGTRTQRARWEGGFLATARGFGLPLVARGIGRADFRCLWMGLHLLTAPLTLLLLLNGAAALLWLALRAIGAGALGLALALGFGVAIGAAVLAAWAAAGRAMLSGAALLRLPLYMVWKLALYTRVAKGDRPAWIRTERVD